MTTVAGGASHVAGYRANHRRHRRIVLTAALVGADQPFLVGVVAAGSAAGVALHVLLAVYSSGCTTDHGGATPVVRALAVGGCSLVETLA